MPVIAKPRAFLLYVVDRLEKQGSQPTLDDLVDVCARIQETGCQIYSSSGNPQDPFLRGDVADGIDDCEGCGWLERGKGYLSVSELGASHLHGLRLPSEIERELNPLLPKYEPAGHP